jgi:hypothetical protein
MDRKVGKEREPNKIGASNIKNAKYAVPNCPVEWRCPATSERNEMSGNALRLKDHLEETLSKQKGNDRT